MFDSAIGWLGYAPRDLVAGFALVGCALGLGLALWEWAYTRKKGRSASFVGLAATVILCAALFAMLGGMFYWFDKSFIAENPQEYAPWIEKRLVRVGIEVKNVTVHYYHKDEGFSVATVEVEEVVDAFRSALSDAELLESGDRWVWHSSERPRRWILRPLDDRRAVVIHNVTGSASMERDGPSDGVSWDDWAAAQQVETAAEEAL